MIREEVEAMVTEKLRDWSEAYDHHIRSPELFNDMVALLTETALQVAARVREEDCKAMCPECAVGLPFAVEFEKFHRRESKNIANSLVACAAWRIRQSAGKEPSQPPRG